MYSPWPKLSSGLAWIIIMALSFWNCSFFLCPPPGAYAQHSSHSDCTSFLLLCPITTNLEAYNNINWLSYGSRVWMLQMNLIGLKSRCEQGYQPPSGDSKEECILLPSAASRSHLNPIPTPCSIFRDSTVGHVFLTLPLLLFSPGSSPHLKVTWLPTLLSSAILIPLCCVI